MAGLDPVSGLADVVLHTWTWWGWALHLRGLLYGTWKGKGWTSHWKGEAGLSTWEDEASVTGMAGVGFCTWKSEGWKLYLKGRG
jgi:hypothetical protein